MRISYGDMREMTVVEEWARDRTRRVRKARENDEDGSEGFSREEKNEHQLLK